MMFSSVAAMGDMTGSLGAFGTPRGTVDGLLSRDGETLTIAVGGRFDFSLHDTFSLLYMKQSAACTSFVIDLSATTSLDSSALGMLLLMRERLGGDKADITLAGSNLLVKRTLDMANFQGIFFVG